MNPHWKVWGVNSADDLIDVWQFKSELTAEGERVWYRVTLADGRQLIDTHTLGEKDHVTVLAREYRTFEQDSAKHRPN